MPLPNLLAWLVLLVGIPLNIVVTVLLVRASRQAPSIGVLRERMVTAAAVLLVVVVFGLIFVNNDTFSPPLSVDLTRLITRSAVLVIAIVPAAYWLWLWLYRNGRDA